MMDVRGTVASEKGFVFRSPFGGKIKGATLNGGECKVEGGVVEFDGLPARIVLTLAE